MQLSKTAARLVNYGKLIGIPILIISFFHPITGVWSAFWNIIMNTAADTSTRLVVAVLYGAAFILLGVTALKGLKVFGFVIFMVIIATITWFLVDQGMVSFKSKEDFGWFGIVIAVLFGYVAVYGASIYRVLTGRVSTDSEDPDT